MPVIKEMVKSGAKMEGKMAGSKVKQFMDSLIEKNPGENEFHQAVLEVVESIMPFIEKNPKYAKAKILKELRNRKE